MTGIYKYTNNLNGLVYIGQAKNLQRRKYAHSSAYKNPSASEYNNQLHTAMRKYGIENFTFEVVEQCKIEELNEREKYWIAFYNSYKKGYNGTEGGDILSVDNSGEANGRAYMTEEEVFYIRECYNNHICFRDVYQQFKHKATKRCIQKIWYFENWKDIHPEYNTPENKEWHRTKAKALPSEMARNNIRAYTDDEVRDMRNRYYNSHESFLYIQKEVYKERTKVSTVRNAILGITYKDVE